MTMITPSYLGETIEYSSLHACRSTLEDPTELLCRLAVRNASLPPDTFHITENQLNLWWTWFEAPTEEEL